MQALGNAAQGLGRAKEGVVIGTVAYLFAFHCVLLVGELEAALADVRDDVRVIQRRGWGPVDGVVNGEVDVSVLEGLGASLGHSRQGALGWSQEPEEGDDDEIDDVSIEGSILRVVDIQGVDESSQDGDVGWVGSTCGFVVAFKGFEERSE